MGEPTIAFVSREVYPFDSAGLGNYVTFAAAALTPVAEVAIVTSTIHERRHAELAAAGDPRLPPGVSFHFVPEPEPDELAGWYGHGHLWSARVFDALTRLYPGGGPSLVEFPDYLGEGFVAAQAARTLDPRLRRSRVCIRVYTTAEMCAVLDGTLSSARDARLLHALERYALRNADALLWPGGGVLSTYESFYGADGVARPTEVCHHVVPSTPVKEPARSGGPLRLLYTGRFERRKGVQNLVRAMNSIDSEDWTLTMIGGDTDTGPLRVSLRDQLRLMVADEPRVEIRERIPRESLRELIAAADVFVSPSLWECWPNTVLEAFELNRPVLATPVGGHLGMIEPGVSGWLADSTAPESLAKSIEELLEDRSRVSEVVAGGGPRRAFEELTDAESVRERYLELCERRRARPVPLPAARTQGPPLVSVVVPYFRMHRYVAETLRSIREQTHPAIELIVVNDGSFEPADAPLERLVAEHGAKLVTQINSGLGQARNLGLELSRGRYVLPVDPDDLLLPTFVERCVEVLEQRPEIAYVTSWSTYVDEEGTPHGHGSHGYRPIGNDTECLDIENVAGSAMAVIRRRVFERGFWFSPDMTSYEDWLLFRELGAAGHEGHVIPEALLLYRVRAESMLRQVGERHMARLRAELDARLREREVAWTPSSA